MIHRGEKKEASKLFDDLKDYDMARDNYSELFESHGPDGVNCINSQLIDLFNEHGHYSADQTICRLQGIPLQCGNIHTNSEPCKRRNPEKVVKTVRNYKYAAVAAIATLFIVWAA